MSQDSTLAKQTFALGTVLVFQGLGNYFGSEKTSTTALIPAFIGAPILLAGVVAMISPKRQHRALRFGSIASTIGLLGSAQGIPALIKMVQGQKVDRPRASVAQVQMASLCGRHVARSIRYFSKMKKVAKEAAKNA